ncbi:hypothetical protein BDZ94DRAFT_1277781 [Collybia nuda]|uniref:Uncharacterized protein n=1 Tax=Collybia nuda TaxID=64659 RepID=A0A9P5XRK9_9AGAR|nr:hypothetical protein BDZ94DRAFT_1277781 [Collybia nuda]
MGAALSSSLVKSMNLLSSQNHKFWPPRQPNLPWTITDNCINILAIHHPNTPNNSTFTYISHHGAAKAFSKGALIRIHERHLQPISGIPHLVLIPAAEGSIKSINDILKDWIVLSVKNHKTREISHLIVPRSITHVHRLTIIIHRALRFLRFKRKEALVEKEIQDLLIKPTASRA